MSITISIDDRLAELLLDDAPEFDRSMRELAVLALLRNGDISTGRACEILGMQRAAFMRLAASHGIPALNISEDDWNAEIARIRSRR